jgi:salicylate hydroxylase
MLSPNGTRVLAKLGFDFEAVKGLKMDSLAVYSGATLENLNVYPAGSQDRIEEALGFPYRAFHRVNLHNQLKELALGPPGEGEGEVEVRLGVKIVAVDVKNAKVALNDRRIWRGDLLVGADGIHSVVRESALRSRGVVEGEETEDVG